MLIGILFFVLVLGSIPTSYFIYWWRTGSDIRQYGSGNIGATNLGRLLGWKFGLFALFFDAGKGLLAVLICFWAADNSLLWATIGGALAVIGHIFPVFWLLIFRVEDKFKGGKGVATALGVLGGFVILGFMPLEQIGMIVGSYVVILLLLDYSSLGTLIASLVALITQAVYHGISTEIILPLNVFILSAVLVIFITHIKNIKRLINKEEPQAGVRSSLQAWLRI